MDVLIVFAHPTSDRTLDWPSISDSMCGALLHEIESTLRRRGHTVEIIDLHREQFEPVMSTDERVAYETDHPIVDPVVRRHADLIAQSQGLVFVYPTVAAGLPAMLKGWMDRVLVPGVAFELDERTNKVKPAMRHIRRLGAVTTTTDRRWRSTLVNDAGRRSIMRTIRLSVHPLARRSWLAIYRSDRRTEPELNVFIDRVSKIFATW